MFPKYYNILSKYKLFRNYNWTCFMSVRIIETPITIKDVSERHIQKLILKDQLGISYQRSAKLLRDNKCLLSLKKHRLVDTIQSLKRMDIKNEDIYKNPLSLIIMDSTIEHNVLYLREAGFKHVTAQMLIRFRSIVKRPISLLKAHGVIPEDTNVAEKLCMYLNPKPVDQFMFDHFTDEDTIVRIHEVIFKKYLEWRLQTTEKNTDRIFRIYDGFKYKSLQLTSEMINLLINKFGFTSKKILQHGYLFAAHSRSIEKICSSLPTLGNLDIKQVLFRHPKLMTIRIDNIQAILKHLHDFGISDDAVQKCYDVFTLSPDSVLHRLNELKKVPEFEALLKNHRVMFLVFFQNKAKLRLQMLQNLNVKCASLHILCASDSIFEKYTQDGNDRTKGSDIVSYLSMEFKQPNKMIREKLSINHHWYHVPLTAIKRSFNFLIKECFNIEDISLTPVILLYPKEQLEDTLKEINSKTELAHTKLTTKQRLNLCLYLIEKKHHFSGDALWLCADKQLPLSLT